MLRYPLVALAFLMIGISACKQIPYKPQPPATVASYLPQTYGSTWQYRDSIFGLATDTFPLKGVRNDIVTYTMNGLTTDFNSLVCYNQQVSSQIFGANTAYSFYQGHKMGIVVSSPPWGQIVLQLLVDTAHAGYKWTSNPVIYSALNGSPVEAENAVVETGMKRIINGVYYTNVVHTSTKVMLNQDEAGFRNVAIFDFYLAPGVGLIEKDAEYYGLLNETETLLTYSIKP